MGDSYISQKQMMNNFKAAPPRSYQQLEVILTEAERVNAILTQDYTNLRAAKESLTRKLSEAHQEVEQLYIKVESLTSQLAQETIEKSLALSSYEQEKNSRMQLEHIHAELGGRVCVQMEEINELKKSSITHSNGISSLNALQSLVENTPEFNDSVSPSQNFVTKLTNQVTELTNQVNEVQTKLSIVTQERDNEIQQRLQIEEKFNTERNRREQLEKELEELRRKLSEPTRDTTQTDNGEPNNSI